MIDSARSDADNAGDSPDLPPTNGVPLDTIGLLIQEGAEPATTGSTVFLQRGREYDLSVLHAQVAMALGAADTPGAEHDLIALDVAASSDAPFRPEVLEQIRRESRGRVLVLRLPPEVPAETLLRGAAAVIRSHAEIVGLNRPRVLLYEPAPRPKIEPAPNALIEPLLEDCADALILVRRADRRLLGRDLARLGATLAGRNITILAGTDLPAEGWGIADHERAYWRDLALDRLYSPRYLAVELLNGLLTRRDRLPAPLRDQIRPEAPLTERASIGQAAAQLGTPLRVRSFLRLIDQARPDTRLDPLLARAAQLPLETLVRAWYEALSRRDQLIALAVALLLDLPEAQLFPALEQLVEGAWGLRAPGQPMLDLFDLAPLHDLIRLDERGAADARPTIEIDSLRAAMLSSSLTAHRRHIQYAQLWLARLVGRSLDLPPDQSDPLFGPPRQRARLRAAVAETLADLALIAPTFAQPGLLLLVADRREAAHHALARALGRWAGAGHLPRLLDLVRAWRSDDRARRLVDALRGPSDDLAIDDESSQDLLCAAGLLALGYAAHDGPPGALPSALAEQIIALAHPAEGRRTLHYLEREILPALLSDRLEQFEPLVRDLALYPALRGTIGATLVRIYQGGGEGARAVSGILQRWMVEGFRAAGPGGRIPQQSRAEDLLTAVAATVGAIDFHHDGPLPLESAWRMMRHILDRIDGRRARAAVVAACMRLAVYDPRQLRWVLGGIRREEEGDLLASLSEICRQQRAELLGRSGESWPDGAPKTAIERALITWLLHSPREGIVGSADTGRLRRLMLRAFVMIAISVDLIDSHRGRRLLRPTPQRPSGSDFYRRKLMPILIAQRTVDEFEGVVADVLPLAIELARDEPDALYFLLDRWDRDDDLEELAVGLRLGIQLDVAPYWGLGVVSSRELLNAVTEALRRGG